MRSRVSPGRLWALFALLFLLIGLQGGVALFVLHDFTQSVAELRMIQGAGTRIDEFGFLLNNFINEMSVSIGIALEGVGSVRPPPTAALAASAEELRRQNAQLRSEPVVRLLTSVSELDAAVAAYDGHVAARAQDEAALVYIRTIEPLADRLLSLDFPLSRQTILAEVARVGEANRQSGILANRVLVTTLTATLAVGLFLGRLLFVSLHEATVQALELERRASELAIAHGIQTSVLPHDLHLPGFDAAAVMLTANEVGGDFYEFRRTGDGGAWIAVGDVTGHGLRAGIVMLMVQSMFATLSADNEPDAASPKRLIERLNRAVFLNLRDRLREVRYVTMIVARMFADGRMVFAGAHTDLLVYRRAGDYVEHIPTEGLWLGLVEDVSHATGDREVRLEPGDVVVFHTDGVTEARDAQGRFFGLDRLADRLRQQSREKAATLAEGMAAAGRDWAHVPCDDMSVMVIKRS